MLPDDIAGLISGRLTAVVRWPNRRGNYWICQCECGNVNVVKASHLKEQRTRSCGCLRTELASARATAGVPRKHMDGHSKLHEYGLWQNMKSRCFNKSNKAYAHYGGRGVTVCERWMTFTNFHADMGPRPPNCSLDRINNDGNYEPGNCRWVDKKTQQNNTRNNRRITHNGKTQTATQWADELGINHGTLLERARRGLSVEKILEPSKMRDLSGLALGGSANGERQRSKTHCKHGHEFNEENTSWYRGNRSCRACHRRREAERRGQH